MLTNEQERALPALRDYLDHSGFVPLYKRIATASSYHTNPNVLNRSSTSRLADLGSTTAADRVGLELARCMMFEVLVPFQRLTMLEQRVAELLVAAGLLLRSDGRLSMGPYQLISAQDLPLLVDRRVNYPGASAPTVYFGSDSLRLAFHVDTARIARTDHVLDLGTGSGLIGLFLGQYSDHVTVTDVCADAIALTHINRRLNRMQGRVEIRQEGCEQTLRSGRRHHVVTFNPPYMPLPRGLDAPVFAKGLGPDGLGHCRMLLDEIARVVHPDGTAYLAASLLGGSEGPFFVEELRQRADTYGLRIDVFLGPRDELRAGAPIFAALGALLHEANPGVTKQECQRRVEHLQLRTLGASFAFPSTMSVRFARDDQPAVRIFHRP